MADPLMYWLDTIERLKSGKITPEEVREKSNRRFLEAAERWIHRAEHGKRPRKDERPRCGAKTRAGHPCRARVHWPKGAAKPKKRCRMHGGLSTGPKTIQGKRKAAKGIGCVYDETTGRYVKISKVRQLARLA